MWEQFVSIYSFSISLQNHRLMFLFVWVFLLKQVFHWPHLWSLLHCLFATIVWLFPSLPNYSFCQSIRKIQLYWIQMKNYVKNTKQRIETEITRIQLDNIDSLEKIRLIVNLIQASINELNSLFLIINFCTDNLSHRLLNGY